MSIFDQVNNGIKEAMKAHDKERLEALRGIKAEFLLIKTAPGNNGEVSDENALKVLVRKSTWTRTVRIWPMWNCYKLK